MSKQDRLSALVALMQDGKTHRAEDLARGFGVSERTIYRDMARLMATGVPVSGTPGEGYRATAETTLPPLNLTGAELEVLTLGLSVLAEAGDTAQQAAARSLQAKLADLLADGAGTAADAPLRPDAQVQRHLTQIRQAIGTRQKLRVTRRGRNVIIRPLRLDFFGRIWRVVCWDEALGDFAALPVGDISLLATLPGLFVEEPGKTLQDYLRS
jgi:predicted DNA-binding transcriptional regulator YafY